jgi:hypothetical protein
MWDKSERGRQDSRDVLAKLRSEATGKPPSFARVDSRGRLSLRNTADSQGRLSLPNTPHQPGAAVPTQHAAPAGGGCPYAGSKDKTGLVCDAGVAGRFCGTILAE